MPDTYDSKFIPEGDDPFEGCVLRERAQRGERGKYEYPNNGLPSNVKTPRPPMFLTLYAVAD